MLWLVLMVAGMLWGLTLLLVLPIMPSGNVCPCCGDQTLPLRTVVLRPFRRLVARRWCLRCDWRGIAWNVPARPVWDAARSPQNRKIRGVHLHRPSGDGA